MTETNSDTTEFAPITTQAEFDAAISERITRVRNRYADYDELKTQAARVEQIEAEHATALAAAVARAEAAESRVGELEASALRLEVATAAGVPVGLLHGATREELEQSAATLNAFRATAARVEPDPNQGRTNATGASSGRFDPRTLFPHI
ncbi:hypothetical protein [Nocardia arthritidis]|uniref:DUF4355 domain-containing protein n=1 Tax=Nocardia arthritidis TaxID=228602 RepID=A0A6G9Y4Q2_9NOCA|nr:hypothetical protein [Nocardia arthritidis]QIS08208.1 hypothetical protein F5544_01425 [Nocardia arthritidis]